MSRFWLLFIKRDSPFVSDAVKGISFLEGDSFDPIFIKKLGEIVAESPSLKCRPLHPEVSKYDVGRKSEVGFRKEMEDMFLAVLFTHTTPVRGHLGRSSEITSSVIGAMILITAHIFRQQSKLLSGWGSKEVVCHKLGVMSGLPGWKNRLDACCQQTPSVARTSMKHNVTRRLKTVGLNAAQTPSKAPAPQGLLQHHGASADVTTANHARTASTIPTSGGGQHARV